MAVVPQFFDMVLPVQGLGIAYTQSAEDTIPIGQPPIFGWYAGVRQSVDQHYVADYILRNTNVPFVPPKPKLLFIATSIFILRAVLAQ